MDVTLNTVYLVEEHSGASGDMAYWMTVFLSADQAKDAVESRAMRRGAPRLRWEGGRQVLTGKPTPGSGGPTYTILPLSVHRSDLYEEHAAVA